jgi:hypothetical protein
MAAESHSQKSSKTVSIISNPRAEELAELSKIIKQRGGKKAWRHAQLLASVGEAMNLPSAGDLASATKDDGEPPSSRDPTSVELARILAAVEGNRVIPLGESARLLAVSKSTIKRNYSHLLVRVGERRVGMKLKDVLALVKAA